jgi:polyphosphate kinase
VEKGRYFNRDLSWVDFNRRVLEEGLRKDLPPLERFRFLSIVSSNFDEFFMVRVAAIKRALHIPSAAEADPSLLTPEEQLKLISEKTRAIMERQYACVESEIFPDLAKGGLELVRPAAYTPEQRAYLENFFMNEIFPVLTPLRIDEETALPSINSFGLNCAFLLVPETGVYSEHIAVVQIPAVLDRIILLPFKAPVPEEKTCWALLEDVVITWGSYFFPGLRVVDRMIFKVNRDADFSVDEKRDENFIEAMEQVLEERETSSAVRMIYSPGSGRLRDELARRFALERADLYEIAGPINLGNLYDLVNLRGFDSLREKAWKIYPAAAFSKEEESLWERISSGDVMVHFPYESFDPVVRFFQDAASDPRVISIKTTLYRTSGNSPIIKALEQASFNGKHVTAMVELKARFDEERNISWANRLEKAGVIVIYGLSRLKVHAKIAMVIRKENDRIKRFLYLSTGNYNDKTARFYEDIGIFTCREELAFDAGLLFNMITGYSVVQPMRRLVIAPTELKRQLLKLIDREAKRSSQGYPGKIMVKINALADIDIIDALYRASQAGVKVLLSVRGICTLVPGVPSLSENIYVTSIVDHYLEHSRIYYFANGGAEELFLSSADWMPRNLDRRVELMFPVQDEAIRKELADILNGYFRDNTQARRLNTDGGWEALTPSGEELFRVQKHLLAKAARAAGNTLSVKEEFVVRRSPPGGFH